MLWIRRHSAHLVAALFALSLTSAAVAEGPSTLARHAETCRFFSNGAFQDRRIGGETTFRMQLAQDCVDALVYVQSAEPDTRARAAAYLGQLQSYRAVIVGMIVARAADRPIPRNDHWGYQVMRPAVHPVSRAGAYLIAQEMGLVDTHRTWTSWRRSASMPLFRVEMIQAN